MYMHNKNLANRDVKPHNCLFDSEFNVKICDFGDTYNAKYLDEN